MTNEYFWNSAKWEINQSGDGVKVHPLVALAIAPLLGGLFVVFMPFIGLYLFGKFMASKAANLVKSLFHISVTPIAEPGSSYMTGSKAKNSQAGEETLKELTKEIQERRNQ